MNLDNLKSIDPRRRVDRKQYNDPDMPEHPGATLLAHCALKGAQVGSVLGCLVFAPLSWARSGRKEALFKTVMPRVGGKFMLGGYVVGGAMVAVMAVQAKPSGNKPPFTNEGVDDRAYRIVKNQNVVNSDNFLAAGTLAALFSGRTQARAGFFGHMSVGMLMSSIAYGMVFYGVPAIRKRWPEVKKSLADAGVDLSILEVPK